MKRYWGDHGAVCVGPRGPWGCLVWFSEYLRGPSSDLWGFWKELGAFWGGLEVSFGRSWGDLWGYLVAFRRYLGIKWFVKRLKFSLGFGFGIFWV